MATVLDTTALRGDLIARRERLTRVSGGNRYVHELLQQIDDALEHMDAGTFGLCDVCHESVEPETLMADPLCKICLDHLSVEERRGLEHDLELAGRVQASLLPQRDLRFAGWEVYTHYAPAGAVSGDFYDVLPVDGDETLVVFGDIAGKGISASLLMASLQAIFRSLTSQRLLLPDLLARANRLFCESTATHSFATLVCARVSPGGSVSLANAGHCPPLVLRQGRVTGLPADGLPVGLFCEAAYAPQRVDLAPGDALVLYTDGLSEARSRAGEEYGALRIGSVLEQTLGLSAQATAARFLADLQTFQGGQPRTDDLTLMVLRRTPSPM
jgi:sigma-B regulation protein RsbU (phosphoserine phosphatase)